MMLHDGCVVHQGIFLQKYFVFTSGGTRLGSAKSTMASLVSMKVDDRNRLRLPRLSCVMKSTDDRVVELSITGNKIALQKLQ